MVEMFPIHNCASLEQTPHFYFKRLKDELEALVLAAPLDDPILH